MEPLKGGYYTQPGRPQRVWEKHCGWRWWAAGAQIVRQAE